MPLRRHRSSAGRSAAARFRQERRSTLRVAWLDWTIVVALIVAAVLTITFADGWLRVTAAWSLGFFMAVATFGWLIGGHVSNLPWAWGAEGERRTEAELRALSDEWHVEHDVADGRANWDHIVIGPGGVFVIDSKTYHRPTELNGDELRSGRIRTPGGTFRGSAVRLKEFLQKATGESTWVQAIVVVWGDFPQRVVEHDKVVYMSGTELRGWLQAQPIRLGENTRTTLFGGIHAPS